MCLTPPGRARPNRGRACCCWALPRGGTVGGDNGYDIASFVAAVRVAGLTPHVAQKDKGSAIDAGPRGIRDTRLVNSDAS
jgi:hypothetical protein